MNHIAILVLDSAWAGSITMCMEVFNVAAAFRRRHSGVEPLRVSFVGVSDCSALTFSGVRIEPQATIYSENQHYNAILIPTVWDINTEFLSKHSALYSWLSDQYDNGAMLFGLLTGAYLIAETGLLDGREATTHWKYADDFRRRYPKVHLQAHRMQTGQDRLYCGGGVTASLELSIQLISQFCGAAIAAQCERHCLMGSRRDYRREHKRELEGFSLPDQKSSFYGLALNDKRIAEMQTWINAHYAEPLSLEEVGARFGFSQRNLTRRFKAATGVTFVEYLQGIRMAVAKKLLRTTSYTIQEVCFEVGYESLTVFGRRFKRLEGVSPSHYKKMKGAIADVDNHL